MLPPSAYPDTVAIALAILFGIGMVTSTLLYMKHVAVRETNRIINAFERLISTKEK